MSRAEILTLVVMLVGLAGTVIPVLPGVLLIWAAGLGWAWHTGWDTGPVVVVVLLTVLMTVVTILKYALPARAVRTEGAPRETVWLAALGAVVGFFVIPVLGLVVGAVAAVYLAELQRLGDSAAAWRSTLAVLRGIGVGVLVELGGAVLMVLTWLVGILLI